MLWMFLNLPKKNKNTLMDEKLHDRHPSRLFGGCKIAIGARLQLPSCLEISRSIWRNNWPSRYNFFRFKWTLRSGSGPTRPWPGPVWMPGDTTGLFGWWDPSAPRGKRTGPSESLWPTQNPTNHLLRSAHRNSYANAWSSGNCLRVNESEPSASPVCTDV